MEELTATGVVALILSTGVVTAIINQGLGGLLTNRRLRSQQDHQLKSQAEEREHQRRLRLEAAHAAARTEFLEDVSGATEWIRHEWGQIHGLDADWVSDHEPEPTHTSVTDVIRALRRVELRHPTRRVRELASELRNGLTSHYGRIETAWVNAAEAYEQRTGNPPSQETFQEWNQLSENLIDALHEPPL